MAGNIQSKTTNSRDGEMLLDICIRGHEYTPENTWISKNGKKRQCKSCLKIRGRENCRKVAVRRRNSLFGDEISLKKHQLERLNVSESLVWLQNYTPTLPDNYESNECIIIDRNLIAQKGIMITRLK